MATKPFTILVFGAGAIGAAIGGRLAAFGHRVVFSERPEVAATLQASGIRLSYPGEAAVLLQPPAIRVAASLPEALTAGPFDFALFALKSFDTPAFIQSAQDTLSHTDFPILCLSNGVENEPLLAAAWGAQRVIAGTVTSAIGRRGAADFVVERQRGVGVADGHPLSSAIAQAFTEAGLNAQRYANAQAMKWSKLLSNLIANASSAILDMPPAAIYAQHGLFQLEMEMLREALAVMARLGLPVVNLPKTPLRLLALGVKLPAALSRPLFWRVVGKGRGAKMPSFHVDLHGGRGMSEVDALNGVVARTAQRLGLDAPVNRWLTDTLLALTRKELDANEYTRQPEKLLHSVRRSV